MEVKGAIKFIFHMANSFKCISSLNCKDIDNKTNEVVSLLQQGENDRIELADENQMLKNYIKDLVDGSEIKRLKKENVELKAYKLIVEEFKKKLKDFRLAKNRKWTWTENEIELLEQKYFPKQVK